VLEFTKMQALGNDYVIIEAIRGLPAGSLQLRSPRAEPFGARAGQALKALAKRLCNRHFGIGADGLILVLPSRKADFRMRIFNSDGSEAEMCGNGIRCFAKYVYERGLTRRKDLRVETLAGIVCPRLTVRGKKAVSVRVDMGQPRLASREIPTAGPARSLVLRENLSVLGKEYKITCVSMGNPHCVLFRDDLERLEIEKLGPAIECHKAFPKRTNVEFVQVISPTRLRMRVWERGVGETLACGTGAAATLVAAVLNGKTNRRATVELLGGNLRVEWNEKTNHVFLAGPGREVFRGSVDV